MSKRSVNLAGLEQINTDEVQIKRTRLMANVDTTVELILPSVSGTIALDGGGGGGGVPANMMTTDTAQTVSGTKTFSIAPKITSIIVGLATVTFQSVTGTVALLGDIATSLADYVTLATNQTISGIKTFSSSPVISSITNGLATLTLPSSTGTLALTTDIPSDYVKLTTNQTVAGQKTFTDTMSIGNFGLFASNVTGCSFYSNPVGGGGSLSFDTSNASASSGVLSLPSLASNASYTLPSTTGYLASTRSSFPSITSEGLNLNDGLTLTTAASIQGTHFSCAASTVINNAVSGAQTNISTIDIGRKTINSATATSFTLPVTVRIRGEPIAGTNTTLSNAMALFIDSGGIWLNAGRVFMTQPGSAVSPAYSLSGSSGMYGNSTTIGFGIGGVQRLLLDSTAGTITSSLGLLLPTAGGTATQLNHYEEFTIVTSATAPWSTAVQWIFDVVRVGKQVTVKFRGADYGLNGSQAAVIQSVTGSLPSRFRPLLTLEFAMVFYYNTGSQVGIFQIDTAGTVTIGLTGGNALTAFQANRAANFYPAAFSYTVS